MKIKQMVLARENTNVYLEPLEDWQTEPSKTQVVCWGVIETGDGDEIVGFVDGMESPHLTALSSDRFIDRVLFYVVDDKDE